MRAWVTAADWAALSGVGAAVPLGVDGRILQPKVGAEVDHSFPRTMERKSKLGGETVRKGEKEKLRAALEQTVDRRFSENQFREIPHPGEPRQNLPGLLARVLAGGNGDNANARMACEDRAEFFAGVAIGADDGDRDALRAHSAARDLARSSRASVRSFPRTSIIS
jgi:hypothetical protein